MESRESSSVDSRTQHTAYVRRSEGMVVVRLRDHFTATRAYCTGDIELLLGAGVIELLP
jgi:hypothetical protein